MPRPGVKLIDAHPDIAATLCDQELAKTISRSSSQRVLWFCTDYPEHQWKTSVTNRVNSTTATGCPYCNGKKVFPGFNDLATTHPEVASWCANSEDAKTYAAQSNKKIDWRCPAGHTWSAPVSRLTRQGSRCPYCSGRKAIFGATDLATTAPHLAQELADPSLAHQLKQHSHQEVEWVCPAGHHYTMSVIQRSKGDSCSACVSFAVTHPDLAQTLAYPEEAWNFSHGSMVKQLWRCPRTNIHLWFAAPYNRLRAGCPVCANKIIIPGFNDIATTHPHLTPLFARPSQAETLSIGTSRKVTLQCPDNPDHQWDIAPSRLTGPHQPLCPQCHPAQTSAGEIDLYRFISELLPNTPVERRNRTLLQGMELDIVIPSHHLAIEYNGVYWHSTRHQADPRAHARKTQAAQEADYQLIHIWEDDWSDPLKRTIIRSMLAHKLGQYRRYTQLYPQEVSSLPRRSARQLTPVRLDYSAQAQHFLRQYHLQGGTAATYHLTLVDEHQNIYALLSLRSPHQQARMKRAEGQWEIIRFATAQPVPGAFSRLLAYAVRYLHEKGETLTEFISFSSHDVSNGHLYRANGFIEDGQLPPTYFYIGDHTRWKRTPKESYQLSRFASNDTLIYEDKWTETQAAAANNLYRIYDSGKTRWVYTL